MELLLIDKVLEDNLKPSVRNQEDAITILMKVQPFFFLTVSILGIVGPMLLDIE